MRKTISIIALIGLSLIAFLVARKELYAHPSMQKPVWKNLGSTPSAAEKYTPQGLTYINGYLYLAESHNDEIGMVYKIDPSQDVGRIVASFKLPYDAVHTSGLAWDGHYLWAVDYVSKKLYQIDLAGSLSSGQAVTKNEYATGLDGPSAITIFNWQQDTYLAVSDFMNTKRTYILKHGSYKAGVSITEQSLFSFKNKVFSQGLTSDGQYLYEATNKVGKDVIYKLDLCKIFALKNFDQAVVEIYQAPADMVEDLAVGDGKIWTSDESTFAIYSTPMKFNTTTNNCK